MCTFPVRRESSLSSIKGHQAQEVSGSVAASSPSSSFITTPGSASSAMGLQVLYYCMCMSEPCVCDGFSCIYMYIYISYYMYLDIPYVLSHKYACTYSDMKL